MKKNIARQLCEVIYRNAMTLKQAVLTVVAPFSLVSTWYEIRADKVYVAFFKYEDGSVLRLYTLDQYLCYGWQKDGTSIPHKMPILFK